MKKLFEPLAGSESSNLCIRIVLAIIASQFCTTKTIYNKIGNKNYNILKDYIGYLVSRQIIIKVPCWHGTAYYVAIKGDRTIDTIAKYHIIKHRVSEKINKIANQNPKLREKLMQVGVRDLNKITRTNIPSKLIDVKNLEINNATIVHFLNLIFLATRVFILEEKRAKTNNLDKLHLVKRQARIGEWWLDLESYLDRFFERGNDEEWLMSIAKSGESKRELKLYQDYFSHMTHSKTTFSEYVKILREILLGYKQEYAKGAGISISAANKILRKFQDKSGRIDVGYLKDMRRIETASVPKFSEEDIQSLWTLEDCISKLNRIVMPDDKKELREKEETLRFAKMIYPEMQMLN